jgi:hypothetical protein
VPGATGGEKIQKTERVLSEQVTAQRSVKEPLKVSTMADLPEEKDEEMKWSSCQDRQDFL